PQGPRGRGPGGRRRRRDRGGLHLRHPRHPPGLPPHTDPAPAGGWVAWPWGALAWATPFALTCGEGQIQAVAGTRLAVSTLLVAAMAGYGLLPPVLAASLVSLFLTSRVSMIETQRERESEEQRG